MWFTTDLSYKVDHGPTSRKSVLIYIYIHLFLRYSVYWSQNHTPIGTGSWVKTLPGQTLQRCNLLWTLYSHPLDSSLSVSDTWASGQIFKFRIRLSRSVKDWILSTAMTVCICFYGLRLCAQKSFMQTSKFARLIRHPPLRRTRVTHKSGSPLWTPFLNLRIPHFYAGHTSEYRFWTVVYHSSSLLYIEFNFVKGMNTINWQRDCSSHCVVS